MKDRDLSVRDQIQSGVSSITVWNLGEPSQILGSRNLGGHSATFARGEISTKPRRNLDFDTGF